jgi:Cu/Ag efflux protein CusF
VRLAFDMQRMARPAILSAIALGCLFLAIACGPSRSAKETASTGTDAKAPNEAKDTSVKRYSLTGRVVSIDKPTRSINVDGDEIPGFMAAMTMPYQVRDVSALEKLSPGDQIKAEIVMATDGAYLENIARVQKAASPAPK